MTLDLVLHNNHWYLQFVQLILQVWGFAGRYRVCHLNYQQPTVGLGRTHQVQSRDLVSSMHAYCWDRESISRQDGCARNNILQFNRARCTCPAGCLELRSSDRGFCVRDRILSSLPLPRRCHIRRFTKLMPYPTLSDHYCFILCHTCRPKDRLQK